MKKYLTYIFILFILVDLGFSFLQHYNTPLDGDIAGGVVPAADVTPILKDPLGLKALIKRESYPNPNKFFSHYLFYKYFNSVPVILHSFMNPVDSVYFSCAIIKTLIQFLLIFILSIYITGELKISKAQLLSMSILIPLIQINGYGQIKIIDKAVTYVFFYALPLIFLLLYFLPIILKIFHGKIIHFRFKIIFIPLILLSLLVALSGPLNPGISLVLMLIIFTFFFFEKKKLVLDKSIVIYCSPLVVLSAYSLFLGSFNSINLDHPFSLLELYKKLPVGIFNMLTVKIGLPLLLVALSINYFLIKKAGEKSDKFLKLLKWAGLFILLYLLLLPLGGYRDYRPFVVRYDTMIPVTIVLMLIYGSTSLFILKNYSKKYKYYPLLLLMISLIYLNADSPKFYDNDCEKHYLMGVYSNKQTPITCKVLSWNINDQQGHIKLRNKLLQKWKITFAN